MTAHELELRVRLLAATHDRNLLEALVADFALALLEAGAELALLRMARLAAWLPVLSACAELARRRVRRLELELGLEDSRPPGWRRAAPGGPQTAPDR